MKITVVGAGIVGCAIAHELASRGARVDLVDARGIGRGATRASAGILAPHIEGHLPQLRRLAACSLALYDEFVRRVENESGQPLEYGRRGTLQAAADPSAAASLSAEAAELAAAGVECTVVEGAEARRLEPALSETVLAALLVPAHGYVAATQLTEALARAAQTRGVRVVTSPVLAIDAGSPVARVSTSLETIESDAVVVASGSWPVSSTPAPPPAVMPIRGQLVHLQAGEAVASRVLWGPDCYLVPWRDGSVLVGATVEDVGFDERSTAAGVRALLNAALTLAPPLGSAHVQEVRVGFRPRASDELPIIGRSTEMPAVIYALGHYRNGVLLAPLTASLVADLVLEGRERAELALVRPGRFAPG